MNIYGYELLYQRNGNDFLQGLDNTKEAAELINDAYFTMQFKELTNGTRAFIYFTKELVEMEIPFLLPRDTIAVVVDSRGVPNVAFFQACRKLKQEDCLLVVDDFNIHESYFPLVDIADIIKVDFGSIPAVKQLELLEKYKGKFLAKNIETQEQYQEARKMGFTWFQGYFFNKPVFVTGKIVDALNTNLIRILRELKAEEPEYQDIADIIEGDLGLSYKLLKLSNTVLFGSAYTIGSIKQALVRLGLNGIKRWVYIMMVKGNQQIENRELIRNSLIRAKLMELLAAESGSKARSLEYFITGMFSSIDRLLNRDMKAILEDLAVTEDVKTALLGGSNAIRRMLDMVTLYERADWEELGSRGYFEEVPRDLYMSLYLEALRWMMELDY
jgi:EAL and modified HD-GYP domain-containing signal transduction protein